MAWLQFLADTQEPRCKKGILGFRVFDLGIQGNPQGRDDGRGDSARITGGCVETMTGYQTIFRSLQCDSYDSHRLLTFFLGGGGGGGGGQD